MAYFLELTKGDSGEKVIFNADGFQKIEKTESGITVYFKDLKQFPLHAKESYEDIRKLLGVDFVGMEKELHSEWWKTNVLKQIAEQELEEEEEGQKHE